MIKEYILNISEVYVTGAQIPAISTAGKNKRSREGLK